MTKDQQEAALRLANRFLDPEDLGLASDPLTRDLARMTVGLRPVECVAKPRIWWSRNGYWICHANARQGYGATPKEAFGAWMAAHV